MGDSAATEDETFAAARRAIDELAAIVSYVFNHLNGNHVVLTADHGFLFTELAPDETDKSRLEEKPVGTVKAKKRCLLGHNLGDHEVVWHGSTTITTGAEGDMAFWVPRGANRFHFVGGARFVHGGAMPQEICVPVVTVKHRKGDAAKGTSTKKVTVHSHLEAEITRAEGELLIPDLPDRARLADRLERFKAKLGSPSGGASSPSFCGCEMEIQGPFSLPWESWRRRVLSGCLSGGRRRESQNPRIEIRSKFENRKARMFETKVATLGAACRGSSESASSVAYRHAVFSALDGSERRLAG